MAEQLTRRDQRLVVAVLDRIGTELADIASWLTGLDEDKAADGGGSADRGDMADGGAPRHGFLDRSGCGEELLVELACGWAR